MTAANVVLMPCCGIENKVARGVAVHFAGDYGTALTAFRAGAWRGYAPAQCTTRAKVSRQIRARRLPGTSRPRTRENHGLPSVLGCMHCMGDAVGEDPAGQAFQWFRLSVERDRAPTQFSQGTMFASGTGLSHDPHEAMKWFLLAAVQGHQQALHDLQAVAASTGRRKRHESEKCDCCPCPVFPTRSGIPFGFGGI